MKENKILNLLRQNNWQEDHGLIQGLKQWQYYPLLLQAYQAIDERALFQSWVHGPQHIHRVLLLAGLIGWQERLEEENLRQLFWAASYHDVGRTFDGYDLYHGARSALRLGQLTGQEGECLLELQAAVTAHSRPDHEMETIVASFQPKEYAHALKLTRLLKDADNLDRVRLGDLNPRFLRHQSAKELTDFAQRLFRWDQGER